MMADTDNTRLLDVLEAHGRQFLESFKPQNGGKKERKRAAEGTAEPPRRSTKLAKTEADSASSSLSSSSVDYSNSDSDYAEEWTGFTNDAQKMEDEDGVHSSAPLEDRMPIASRSAHKPDVVVFSGHGPKGSQASSQRMQGKAFMSSKVSKLRGEIQAQRTNGTTDANDDEDDELTNAQNDALLHRLVHTKLLSGSLNPELGLTSAQRKKALEGRILELSGSSKLGQGEKRVRAQERDKASKRVREGLLENQKRRREKLIQEAKDMGNYHPAFKKSFQDPLEKSTKRNREKGLGMGVGSYGRGVLRLNKRDIESVQGDPTRRQLRGQPRHKK